MRKNFFSSKEVRSEEIILLGLAQAITEAQKLGANRVWLVAPIKRNLDGYAADAIGQSAADALAKGKAVRAGDMEVVFLQRKDPAVRYAGSPVILLSEPTVPRQTRRNDWRPPAWSSFHGIAKILINVKTGISHPSDKATANADI